MNGVHDLGGMHGFGPVIPEEHEPPFHAPWEAVMVAIQSSLTGRIFSLDEFRYGIERMDPVAYLSSTYYEHWLDGITRVLEERGEIDLEELDDRTAYFLERLEAPPASAFGGFLPPLDRRLDAPRTGFRREGAAPRFAPGDPVRTVVMHPVGHTRLPRYARGKRGVIERFHGVHIFPDTNAMGGGEAPAAVYSVLFEGRELWGRTAEPGLSVNLDLWEPYLEPDSGAVGGA